MEGTRFILAARLSRMGKFQRKGKFFFSSLFLSFVRISNYRSLRYYPRKKKEKKKSRDGNARRVNEISHRGWRKGGGEGGVKILFHGKNWGGARKNYVARKVCRDRS